MATQPDYLIVGSGSAGSVLATRLSEDADVNVTVLEVGTNNRDFRVYMPTANAMAMGHPKFDWAYKTEPQPHLANRQISWPRGRGLGGSSAINGMIYIRGNARDYDRWRQLGRVYGDVLPYFRKAESRAGGGDMYRGDEGPLLTGPAGGVLPIERAFVEAFIQAGLPANPDFNGAGQVGAGMLGFTIRDGARSSVARCYLGQAAACQNLEVRTGCFVTVLIVENGRAVGVRYKRDGAMNMKEARAEHEVIVCQGAIGSPQLLMLSGIGPVDHLREMGIDVIADVPGVGQNLHDHLNIPMQFACIDPRATFDCWQKPHMALWLAATYFLSGGKLGPGGNAFWSAGAFSQGEADEPEFPKYQVFFTPMVVNEDTRTHQKTATGGFQLDVNQMHPETHGWMKLRSTDPREHPILEPMYLTEERDRQEFIEGVKWVREIVGQSAFDRYRGPEMSPGEAARTDAEILDGVARGANSGYHPVGTCKMGTGSDPMAVTNAEGRVRGVDGLRVVDASLMPILVTGNTNAPTIMMAAKIADVIRGRSPLPRADV